MIRRISADAPSLRIAFAACLFAIAIVAVPAPRTYAGDDTADAYQARGRDTPPDRDVVTPGDDDQPTISTKRQHYIEVTTRSSDAGHCVASRDADAGAVATAEQSLSARWASWVEAVRVLVVRLGLVLRTPS